MDGHRLAIQVLPKNLQADSEMFILGNRYLDLSWAKDTRWDEFILKLYPYYH